MKQLWEQFAIGPCTAIAFVAIFLVVIAKVLLMFLLFPFGSLSGGHPLSLPVSTAAILIYYWAARRVDSAGRRRWAAAIGLLVVYLGCTLIAEKWFAMLESDRFYYATRDDYILHQQEQEQWLLEQKALEQERREQKKTY